MEEKMTTNVRGLKDLEVGATVEVFDLDKEVWVPGKVIALYTRPNRALVKMPGQEDPDVHSQPWNCIRLV